jgi:cell division protein ZapA (FtsZ GTPase activity inhibitor)
MTEGRADVEILGQRLSVRGRGTPEYIQQLADHLNGRIQNVREQARVFDPLRLSLLAGLHLADELYRHREAEQARESAADLVARVDDLTARLRAALELPPGT